MKTALKVAILAILFSVSGAIAGAIHSWSPGETVTSGDLNAALAHMHTLMVGGHGGRLVDADVNASANIATSKLAAKSYIPKAWGRVLTSCSSSPCTIEASQGVSSITKTGTGAYTINLSYTATDAHYAVLLSGEYNGAAWVSCRAGVGGTTTTTVSVGCVTTDMATAANAGFDFVIIDDN